MRNFVVEGIYEIGEEEEEEEGGRERLEFFLYKVNILGLFDVYCPNVFFFLLFFSLKKK